MQKVDFYWRHRLIQIVENTNLKGNYRLVNWLSKMLIPRPTGEMIIQTQYDFPLLINPKTDRGVEESLYNTGSYEKGTLHIMRQMLREGDVFVDAGANIGLMTVFAARLVGCKGEVLAFEPNPDTKKLLDFNVQLNHLDNVRSFGVALGAEPGTARLYTNWHINRGAASLLKPDNESGYYETLINRLDGYISPEMPVRLIKIDVEGYETEVISGALSIVARRDAPALIVENNESSLSGKNNPVNLRSLLKNINDYRFFRLHKGKGRISGLIEIKESSQIPPFNNIFCLTEKHIGSMSPRLFDRLLPPNNSLLTP